MLRAFGCVLLVFSSLAFADPAAPVAPAQPADSSLATCAARVYDDYAESMTAWEQQWADSVVSTRPELADAAHSRAASHVEALQRDGYRIHYFAANRPSALNLKETVAALRLFDWTADDEHALSAADASYAALESAAEHAQSSADLDTKRDELESYFEENFTESNGAPQIHDLSQALRQGNIALEACRQQFGGAVSDLPSTPPIPAKK